MAKNFSIEGDFSGKLGEVVGFRLFGQPMMRKYEPRRHDPRTEKQVLQRARFSTLSKLTRAFRDAIALGMGAAAKMRHMYAGNLFYKLNQDALSGTDPESVAVDMSQVRVATGLLPQVTFGAANFEEAKTVTVSFQSNSEVPGAKDDDDVYLYVYNPDWNLGVLSAPAKRSVKSASVTLPGTWSGLEVHVYGFVMSEEKEVSESLYIGSGTLA